MILIQLDSQPLFTNGYPTAASKCLQFLSAVSRDRLDFDLHDNWMKLFLVLFLRLNQYMHCAVLLQHKVRNAKQLTKCSLTLLPAVYFDKDDSLLPCLHFCFESTLNTLTTFRLLLEET